jgi:hypothetical protein
MIYWYLMAFIGQCVVIRQASRIVKLMFCGRDGNSGRFGKHWTVE